MITQQVEQPLAVFADAVGGLLDVPLDGLAPHQKSRRNHAHHHEIHFRQPGTAA